MMCANPWLHDDDGYWQDELPGWEEVEDTCGPEYFMWLDKLDAETDTWKPPRQTLMYRSDWTDHLC